MTGLWQGYHNVNFEAVIDLKNLIPKIQLVWGITRHEIMDLVTSIGSVLDI